MDRKKLYEQVKKLKLEEAIKAKMGRNFTQVSSSVLEDFVKKATTSKPAPKKEETTCKMTGSVEAKFVKLVEVLAAKRILLKSELTAIQNA